MIQTFFFTPAPVHDSLPHVKHFSKKVRENKLTGYINPTVVDEFFHKILLTDLYIERNLSARDAIAFIKENPETLHAHTRPYTITREVLEQYHLSILDTSHILNETLRISHQDGLLFSDALHAACAKAHNIDYFATNDRDFTRVDFLTLVHP